MAGDGRAGGQSGDVRVGTASWTDPEFIKAGWYPPEVKDDAEGRLRYYADRFAMVEVNSTFYALPRTGLVESWAARTPDDHQMWQAPSSDTMQGPIGVRGVHVLPNNTHSSG